MGTLHERIATESHAMRAVLQVFENYQKARVNFVQTVAELATRPQNIEALQSAGVMALLRPLLLDNVPSIQQSAALALGRLANYSDELAEAVVSNEILPQLVYSLSEQNRFYKKAAAFVIRAVAKHSPELAQAVVDSNALDALVSCLEEFDPSVKRIAASALSDTCKHSPELAQTVVDANAVAYLAPLIQSSDAKLKRQVCSCLSQIAKHSVDLTEMVVEAEIFPTILTCLKDPDPYVRKNAATSIREAAKHTPELAQLIVNAGGVGALVDYVNESEGNARLPGIMTLGYIAAFSETLANQVISARGVPPLVNALVSEPEDHIKSASAWSLGQIGRHSPEHARALADAHVLPKLLAVFMHPESSDDLRTKAKRALKSIIEKCLQLGALEPLISEAPPQILKYVLQQFAKVLPSDTGGAKKQFVTSGCLKKIQQLRGDEKIDEFVKLINGLYPEDIVEYYSPNFHTELLKKLENV